MIGQWSQVLSKMFLSRLQEPCEFNGFTFWWNEILSGMWCLVLQFVIFIMSNLYSQSPDESIYKSYILVYFSILQLSHLMTKPTKWHVRPTKTQISLGIPPVWSGSSLSTRRKLGSLATHWAHSEDSDQTGRMPRLIWVFAGHTPFCWFCHEVAHFTTSKSKRQV